jgi:hypothetical protein
MIPATRLVICGTTLLTLAQSCRLFADDNNKYSRESLAGIASLGVVVEELPTPATKLGLTKEAIQTDVELKLRLAGMEVDSTNHAQYLYVEVNVLAANNRSNAVNIHVEMAQAVTLHRDAAILTTAATWSISELATNVYTAQDIRDLIKDQVDRFLNAWLSVNPKR